MCVCVCVCVGTGAAVNMKNLQIICKNRLCVMDLHPQQVSLLVCLVTSFKKAYFLNC